MNRRSVFATTVVVVVLAALGGLVLNERSSERSPDSTTPSSADDKSDKSTTTERTGPTAVLTGLPLADDGIRQRPVLTVKIDNHPQARPQFGIDRADVIVEEKVEGGLSRFMALYQSEDADRVGPVRSLRSTDANWLKPTGGMIAYSGGIPQVKSMLGPAGVTDLGADSHGVKYYKRRSDRTFEHSLYVNTNVMRELTPKNSSAPKPLFDFLGKKEQFGGAGVAPVNSVTVRMADGPTAVTFDWTWNPQSGKFLRGTDGKAHDIENQGQIAMTNVIVQFTPYAATPWRDRANSVVDEALVDRDGEAWVLSGGKLVKGHWSRTSPTAITKYVDATGAPIKLQPGRTWVSLVPLGLPNEIR